MSLDTGAAILAVAFAMTGGLAVMAAAFNWDWFFNAENARMLTGGLSRRAARIVYLLVGLSIIAMAWFVI